ncbi:ribosome maturation factor RimM [Anderseniella sp. Alg231-50]|uniref:ribosome maturation factor RimM n=1 Tax=Anderseniella sp. Alg231-50 TaxID=1922226 RepID=UPI000D54D090
MPEHSRIVLGVITGVHGIQGEVKLKSFTAEPEAIASYGPLDTSNGTVLKIKSLKVHKDQFRARIEGVTDRNTAETLRGLELSIARDRLPEPEDDEVYHADLIGLSVLDQTGTRIATVVDIVDFGAGELLELKLHDVKSTVLMPFSRQTVPDISLDAGTLTIDPPDGLLGDDTE